MLENEEKKNERAYYRSSKVLLVLLNTFHPAFLYTKKMKKHQQSFYIPVAGFTPSSASPTGQEASS